MPRSIVAGKRNVERKTKVKTGCATCRIRKVKCDENRPFCRRCISTGRNCDGYESPFRSFTILPTTNAHTSNNKPDAASQSTRPNTIEITPQDVDLLNRYFTTKTMFDVELNCDEEARQILQASVTDPPVRHAVLSLRALREHLETIGDDPEPIAQQTPGYHYGLQQYNMALGGLASNLSSPSSNGLKSALLCCQIFISIEQVRKNYAAMAQHINRGLRIMHEYRARPGLVSTNRLVAAYHDELPCLDVFIIKLFAAPCKFAEPPVTADTNRTTSPEYTMSPQAQPAGSRDLRMIAPDMRTEIIRISTLTLDFLSNVSQVNSVEMALRLLSEKSALLDSLELWFSNLELVQAETGFLRPEPVAVSFLRLFYFILKVVLVGALDYSPDVVTKLKTENDQLQEVANHVGERVGAYRCWDGTSNNDSERATKC